MSDDTRQAHRVVNPRIDPIEQKNTHDFTHYLKNSAVHIALFRAIIWNGIIDQVAPDKAVVAYAASTPLGQFASLITKIKQLWPHELANWREVIQCFRAF